MNSPIIVILQATFAGEEDARAFRVVMDPDLIRRAATREEAIAEFRRIAPHVGEVADFEYFEISKWRYCDDFWKSRKAKRA